MPINEEETSFYIPIDLPNEIKGKDKRQLLDDVGEYIVTAMLDYIGEAKTPVSGGKFKKTLSSEYAKREGKKLANLDLNGDMLNALTWKIASGGLEIGIFDEAQAIKSYNHNIGDTLPQRQFIPNDGQSLKKDIVQGIESIIGEYVDNME
jgi:hypothetical protein